MRVQNFEIADLTSVNLSQTQYSSVSKIYCGKQAKLKKMARVQNGKEVIIVIAVLPFWHLDALP
jgi:hypothetical protein